MSKITVEDLDNISSNLSNEIFKSFKIHESENSNDMYLFILNELKESLDPWRD